MKQLINEDDFAQWQKEQMIKDAIEGIIEGSLKIKGIRDVK